MKIFIQPFQYFTNPLFRKKNDEKQGKKQKLPIWHQNLQDSTPFYKSATNIILFVILGIFLILALSFFILYPRWQKKI